MDHTNNCCRVVHHTFHALYTVDIVGSCTYRNSLYVYGQICFKRVFFIHDKRIFFRSAAEVPYGGVRNNTNNRIRLKEEFKDFTTILVSRVDREYF